MFYMYSVCVIIYANKDYYYYYKALGRSIANYATPVGSIHASDTSLEKMPSIDHLHSETKMLLVNDHLNLLSVQNLVHCLDTDGSSTEGNEEHAFH